MFRIQSEVGARVASVLRIQLAERESRSLQRPPTTNAEAYDLYLRTSNRFGRSVLEGSITQLASAVRLDSTFSLAWARLASHLITSVFNFGEGERRLDSAEVAIRRALALDSGNAQAWIARQSLEWNAVRGWHFAEALRDVRHAVALKPSLVEGHNSLGSLYFHYGFMEEAEREFITSLSLDPSDGCSDLTRCQGFSRPRLARVLWYRQMFDSALVIFNRMPFIGGFVWEKAAVLNALGRAGEGLALLDSAAQSEEEIHGDRLAVRALLHATLGNAAEALRHVEAATSRSRRPLTLSSRPVHDCLCLCAPRAPCGSGGVAAPDGRQRYAELSTVPERSEPRDLQGDPAYEGLMSELQRTFMSNAALVHVERRCSPGPVGTTRPACAEDRRRGRRLTPYTTDATTGAGVAGASWRGSRFQYVTHRQIHSNGPKR